MSTPINNAVGLITAAQEAAIRARDHLDNANHEQARTAICLTVTTIDFAMAHLKAVDTEVGAS